MGELMRRYWQPVAAVAELDEHPMKALRLMGEDLVLYRDASGAYGLLDRHCPHRRADLSYGIVEECGLRCNYHGWLFERRRAAASQQPFEEIAHPEARFKDNDPDHGLPRAGQGRAAVGLPGPDAGAAAPGLGSLPRPTAIVQIVFSEVPCNWLQCQENSIDPVHFEWLHSNWSAALRGDTGRVRPTHLKVGFDEFEYGFVYRRVRTDTTEDDELWTVGRVCLWPNCLYTGDHFEWRVPDRRRRTRCSVGWFIDGGARARRRSRRSASRTGTAPITDPDRRAA